MSREKWMVRRPIRLISLKDLLISLLARKMEEIDKRSEPILRNSKYLLFNPRLIRTIISNPLPPKVLNYSLNQILNWDISTSDSFTLLTNRKLLNQRITNPNLLRLIIKKLMRLINLSLLDPKRVNLNSLLLELSILFIPMKKEFLRLEIKSILKTSTQSL
jgi:hypothetical protein